MKKVLSCFLALGMLIGLLIPAFSAEEALYPADYLCEGLETATDLNKMYKWDATTEFSTEGVFGSAGAAKLNVTSVNGGAEYRMHLTEGKMYRFSAYVKPLDFTLNSATLILLTEAAEGGSGWEQVAMSLGTATEDGYIPVFAEYRVSDRVYIPAVRRSLSVKKRVPIQGLNSV